MLERFLPGWFQRPTQGQDTERPIAEAGLPFPVGTNSQSGSKPKWKGGDLKLVAGAAISHPIPRSSSQSLSLSGIEISDDVARPWQYQYSQSSPTRSGPSNVEWKVDSLSDSKQELEFYVNRDVGELPISAPAPPEVVRLPSRAKLNPIARSHSAPISSIPGETISASSTFSSAGTTFGSRGQLKLNINPTFRQSASSLVDTDVYAHAYNHPLVKQLSPIMEQDYFSPVSLHTPVSLPNGASNPSIAYTMSHATNDSPGGSQKSVPTRPSPSFSTSNPFIARQLNRTISQTSSRTQASTSSLPRVSASTLATGSAKPSTPTEPPSLPPLSLAPPFPGPHPSPATHDSTGPPLRPRRLPTIEGSSESYNVASEVYGGEYDSESLHSDSFITASPRDDVPARNPEVDIVNESFQASAESAGVASEHSKGPPGGSGNSILPPSTSESFIGRRWDRDAALGTGIVTFRTKDQWFADCTPAFWTFWLGFIFPVLWFVGGWHFTRFGEQPPRLTFWEFYFNAGFWKRIFNLVFCCGSRKSEVNTRQKVTHQRGHGPDVEKQAESGGTSGPRLPRWVAEKQSSDDGRLRLQDPKRSLRGISYGYPFIPRPVSMRRSTMTIQSVRWRQRVINILERPHKLFDCFYGVKLREVRGRPESTRRMFDPWIQRCRYAFCYALLLLCVGLAVACTLLIVFNTRSLR